MHTHDLSTWTHEHRFDTGNAAALRVPFGYWEAKDTKDDLDTEIEKKFRPGAGST